LLLKITKVTFDELIAFCIQHQAGWPARFSTNLKAEVWVPPNWGNSDKVERKQLRGQNATLDAIVDECLNCRREEGGGRFFINDKGAYYAPEVDGLKTPQPLFIKFDIVK
jgi:hypothetical protein